MDDPLLACLAVVGRFHGRAVSPEAATAGLPLVENRLTPALMLRAANRSGFAARMVRRPLKKIPRLVLPVVLILENNEACVLASITKDKAEIILPDVDEGSNWVSLDELEKLYVGYAIFLKPEFSYEERTELHDVPVGSSWFWGTLWRFRKIYAQLIPASIMINVFALAVPLFIMTVYDRVVPNQAMETLTVLAIGAVIVFVFDFVIKMLRTFFVDRAGKRADVLMASAIYEQIMGIELSERPSSAGAFANQAKGYETVREFFTSATVIALIDLPFVVLFIWLIFVIGGTAVALVPFTAALIVIVSALVIQIPLRGSVKDAYKSSTERHGLLVETVSGLESLKAASAESNFQRRMEDFVRSSAEVEVKSRWYSTLATTLTSSMLFFVTVGVVVVSVFQIRTGAMTQGAMIACVILSGRGLSPLAKVASLLTRLQQSMTALKGLNEIMKKPRERAPGREYVSRPEFRPDIKIDKVSFAYPGQQVPALSEVNLQIRPGEKVGLLGKIGSGKTTLLRLLMKFYPPTDDIIKLSGIDILQLNPSEVRRKTGYVPQDITLFFGSVKENILMGHPWLGDEALKRASSRAGVDRFVSDHPMGFDLQVGERGESLSGGQRQSIALARALVAEPILMLLDEPTSGMDPNAEREFLEDVRTYLEENPDRTLLLSTHKPAMLQLVDRVMVLDQGRVVADGPKTEVLQKLQGGGKAA